MRVGEGKWTLRPEPRPGARVRFLVFHHAGGGAYGYRHWARKISPEIEVVLVQLPGRESRIGERPLTSTKAVLDGLIGVLAAEPIAPYAVFGHSLGGLLAFRFAQRIERTAELPPLMHLFISSARPPRAASAHPPKRKRMADAELLAWIGGLGGTPAALIEHPSAMSAFLPSLRADVALLDDAAEASPVRAPATLIRGSSDPAVVARHHERWRAWFAAPLREAVLPGGHFYFQRKEDDLFELIVQRLAIAAS